MLNHFEKAVISQEIGPVVRALKFHPECMMGIIGVSNFQFAMLFNRKIEIVKELHRDKAAEVLKNADINI